MNQNVREIPIDYNQGYNQHPHPQGFGKQIGNDYDHRMNHPTMLELPSPQAGRQLGQPAPGVDPRFGAYQNWQNMDGRGFRQPIQHAGNGRYHRGAYSQNESTFSDCDYRCNRQDLLCVCCLLDDIFTAVL